MQKEIQEATQFLARLLPKHIDAGLKKSFTHKVESQLLSRFAQHWHTANPARGSAYRALISFHGHVDPVLISAAKQAGIDNIGRYLPLEFTLWIDPGNVSYRMGDHGSIGVVYDASTEQNAQEKSVNNASAKERKPVRVTADHRAPGNAGKPKRLNNRIQRSEITVTVS
jgi:protein Tob/BTG